MGAHGCARHWRRERALCEDDGRGRARYSHSLDRALDLAPYSRRRERVVGGDLAEVENEPLTCGDHEAEGDVVREHVEHTLVGKLQLACRARSMGIA